MTMAQYGRRYSVAERSASNVLAPLPCSYRARANRNWCSWVSLTLKSDSSPGTVSSEIARLRSSSPIGTVIGDPIVRVDHRVRVARTGPIRCLARRQPRLSHHGRDRAQKDAPRRAATRLGAGGLPPWLRLGGYAVPSSAWARRDASVGSIRPPMIHSSGTKKPSQNIQ